MTNQTLSEPGRESSRLLRAERKAFEEPALRPGVSASGCAPRAVWWRLPMYEAAPRLESEPVNAGAIVVLGCRVEPSGRLIGASARRAARAARAFHEGTALLVIASGGVRWGGVLEADALCRELVLSGVPRRSILLERRSNSTRQNARFVAQLIEEHNGPTQEIAIVTCDWHMPRALRCFQWVGLCAVGLPAASPGVRLPRRLVRGAGELFSGWVDRALLERGHGW